MNRSRDPRIPTGADADDGLVLAWEQASGGYVLVEGGSGGAAGPLAYCRVGIDADYDPLSNDGMTPIEWTAELADNAGMFDLGDPTKIVLPNDGLYRVHFHGSTDGAGYTWQLLTSLNGTQIDRGAVGFTTSAIEEWTVDVVGEAGDELTFAGGGDAGGAFFGCNGGTTISYGTHLTVSYQGPVTAPTVEVAPYCKVKLSELLTWNNGTFLDFDTVVSDASGMLTAADTFTMPRAGRWLAHLHMHTDGGGGWASLVRNSDTADAFGARQYIEDGPPNSFTFLITVEEGDEISVFNDYGSTIYAAGVDYDAVQGTAIEFLYLGPA